MSADAPRPTVRINTSDVEWLKLHATETEIIPYGTDASGVMYFQAEIKVWSVEHVTFAGTRMIRFDFITGGPSDHAKGAMYPESYLVEEES
jgi:hypothetical protein